MQEEIYMTELNFQEIMNFYPTNIDVFNNMKRDYKITTLQDLLPYGFEL